ncbi:glycerol-3-phosphate 1-O-acyltransferase PlsY [Lactobacillus gigeriorum]|uniref:Glycerol-3-phosphate acyltransferase n=1 Tax=Lactobacillus gigeriorum DSM 23908 = CRBIP 24.85 TaxID=1423751 RepID=I7J3M4_9LACO|nr:glycerol-3-phosphate 1-O-acyltransferase PlsY [Lactobacillus gigeriorum]KRN14601.1 membrane protein [Lactobacillus gigeriorum DSM 23908 = CRBIP 24.85]CCI87802.1 Glycerol-3-phosphate acyltransferase 2 [Lactobacillus gigeriorum DSM 23908 = CRBIP 24.85]
MTAFKIASLLILAYLLGSFPTGVIVGKTFFQRDIRDYGSGNIGTTNTFRVLGPRAGVFVFLIDFFKGTIATLLPVFFKLGPHWLCLIFGLAAILGHAFSIFLKFKGGKAVATSAGFLLGYNLQFFGICTLIFFPLLFLTSMVSLTSLIAVVLIFIASLFFKDLALSIMAGTLIILIYWSHRSNIKRIISGKENMVPFGIYYWYKTKHQK